MEFALPWRTTGQIANSFLPDNAASHDHLWNTLKLRYKAATRSQRDLKVHKLLNARDIYK